MIEIDGVWKELEWNVRSVNTLKRGTYLFIYNTFSPSLGLHQAYLAASSHFYAGYSINAIRKYLT